MSMHAELARPCGRPVASARAELIARRLERFRPEVRLRVERTTARHPWIADLAVSFPALLFALAFPRSQADAEAALRLVAAGAPLANAAAAADVPMWMRAFPPEAFAAPIPTLPDGPDFRRRIANHFPPRWKDAPRWIERVAHAAAWGDDEIALWFAREAPLTIAKRRKFRRWRRDPWRIVCLWAWFFGPGRDRMHTDESMRWHSGWKWDAAQSAAETWRATLTLSLFLGEPGLADVWLEPGEIDGYAFAPLRTAREVEAEAAAMRNCLRTYGSSLAANDYRLWSVRRDGIRVATLSLSSRYGPRPIIVELSGEANQDAPEAVWLAARRWLHAHDASPFDTERIAGRDPKIDARAWRSQWRPYWLAKQRIPSWLPLAPNERVFYDL